MVASHDRLKVRLAFRIEDGVVASEGSDGVRPKAVDNSTGLATAVSGLPHVSWSKLPPISLPLTFFGGEEFSSKCQ